MKTFIILCIAVVMSGPLVAQDKREINILFWNLENFFDYQDGGANESDKEFSSFGSRHWTKTRFLAKCNAIAKSLMWIAGEKGALPDIFAMAEVENSRVLYRLLKETALSRYDYRIVHYDSPDSRGIDVALLYRTTSLTLVSSSSHRVSASDGQELVTRDILLAEFIAKAPQSAEVADRPVASRWEFALLVNHHPSKYGGGGTDWKRQSAISRMTAIKDSLVLAGTPAVISTGDFNEQANSIEIARTNAQTDFVNLGADFADRGLGTIRYNGIWEMIDMFMVTPDLTPFVSMDVVEIPFLTVWDNVHSGMKPLRTYSGPKYLGGVSDHRPILLNLKL